MIASPDARRPLLSRVLQPLALLALMWAVRLLDVILPGSFNAWLGIESWRLGGLDGLVFAPLLHASWTHLMSNSVPFAVLGVLVCFDGVRRFWGVTAIAAVIGGAGTWVANSPEPSRSAHPGWCSDTSDICWCGPSSPPRSVTGSCTPSSRSASASCTAPPCSRASSRPPRASPGRPTCSAPSAAAPLRSRCARDELSDPDNPFGIRRTNPIASPRERYLAHPPRHAPREADPSARGHAPSTP